MTKQKIISAVLALILALSATSVLVACNEDDDAEPKGSESQSESDTSGETGEGDASFEPVDYAASVQPGEDSVSVKQIVKSVYNYIDGDTTHFNVDTPVNGKTVVKARYLGVNTPESTGKIEEWGKAASTFTKETLKGATSIMIESDTTEWDIDSTGERCLLWIWYKTSEDAAWRNLNIELLQNGLGIASNSANNRYGTVCMAAIAQAKAQKLRVYSGEKDPDFYYGDAKEITLKELRRNISEYNNVKVAFTGVVSLDSNNGVYVESYDAETDMYYGIYVYYGFNLSAKGLEIINEGNEVRFVGTVQYYEAGGTWQVAGISCNAFKPNDPDNLQLISEGHQPGYQEVTASDFLNKKVTFEKEDETTYQKDFAELAMDTSMAMKGLTVTYVYTTESDSESSNGAMTLTCKAEDGSTITVRTTVLFDENGKKITEDAYMGKTIDVQGIVGYYNGKYQVKVVSARGITING